MASARGLASHQDQIGLGPLGVCLDEDGKRSKVELHGGQQGVQVLVTVLGTARSASGVTTGKAGGQSAHNSVTTTALGSAGGFWDLRRSWICPPRSRAFRCDWCSSTGGVRRSSRIPGGLRRGVTGSGRIRPVDLHPGGPFCRSQSRCSGPGQCGAGYDPNVP
jgi:hypothetical protein